MPPPPQLPVRSGFPLAIRGVGSFDSSLTARSLAKSVGGGAGCPGVIAARTLAGTGMTTYTLPVSVSTVVRSRTSAAVAPLGDLAGVVRLDLVQRIVPVLIVAVDELGGRRSLGHDDALRHVPVVERGLCGCARRLPGSGT